MNRLEIILELLLEKSLFVMEVVVKVILVILTVNVRMVNGPLSNSTNVHFNLLPLSITLLTVSIMSITPFPFTPPRSV